MQIEQIFELQEKIETRVNSYWTFWSVAVFAIGGWLIEGNPELDGKKYWIAIAVLIFFICNLSVIWPATKFSMSLRDEIRIKSKASPFKSERLQSELQYDFYKIRLHSTLLLHLVVDFIVVILILKAKGVQNSVSAIIG